MRKIIIGFSHPNHSSLFSQGIMWWQGTPFSHTYIKFETDYGNIIYHAAKTMVHFVSEENFLKDNIVLYEFAYYVNEEEYKDSVRKAIQKAGIKYSICQIICIFWYELLQKLHIKSSKIEINDSGEYICSELAAGFVSYESDNMDYITPLQVFNYIKDLSKTPKADLIFSLEGLPL